MSTLISFGAWEAEDQHSPWVEEEAWGPPGVCSSYKQDFVSARCLGLRETSPARGP